jgi:hypothetical protein
MAPCLGPSVLDLMVGCAYLWPPAPFACQGKQAANLL